MHSNIYLAHCKLYKFLQENYKQNNFLGNEIEPKYGTTPDIFLHS